MLVCYRRSLQVGARRLTPVEPAGRGQPSQPAGGEWPGLHGEAARAPRASRRVGRTARHLSSPHHPPVPVAHGHRRRAADHSPTLQCSLASRRSSHRPLLDPRLLSPVATPARAVPAQGVAVAPGYRQPPATDRARPDHTRRRTPRPRTPTVPNQTYHPVSLLALGLGLRRDTGQQ